MIDTAIVLAGGFGTRLREVVKDVPKPMASVENRPFLEYILDYLSSYGIKNVLLSVGYLHDVIENHFQSHYKNLSVFYYVEESPLGTGGAVKAGIDALRTYGIATENVIIVNGDTFFDVDLHQLTQFHHDNNSDFTLGLRSMDHFDRFGTVEITENGKIIGFREKQYQEHGLINGGVYVAQGSVFERLSLQGQFSLEKDFLEKFYDTCNFYGTAFNGYFIDIGIPEEYARAQQDFKKFNY